MSCRVDTAPLVPGACVVGTTGLGVPGSHIRATTAVGQNGPGLLYNDWDGPADDAKELRVLILSGAPSGMVAYEDGAFEIPAGTASGVYSIGYRLFADGQDLGTTTATVTLGAT